MSSSTVAVICFVIYGFKDSIGSLQDRCLSRVPLLISALLKVTSVDLLLNKKLADHRQLSQIFDSMGSNEIGL